MAYIYESDVGRLGGNLQTTVAYLLSLHKAEYEWNLLGIKVVGHVDALPIPDGTYEYGDAYTVGTAAPYDMWIYTRADEFHAEAYWFNIGKFPAPGPQGPKGDGVETFTIISLTHDIYRGDVYGSNNGQLYYGKTTIQYKDSTTGQTKNQDVYTSVFLPIVGSDYINIDSDAANSRFVVRLDDTALALDYIKLDKTKTSAIPQNNGGVLNWLPSSISPTQYSLVQRDVYGNGKFQALYSNLLVGLDVPYQQADMNEVYRACRTAGTDQIIDKTPTDTGTMSAGLLAVFTGTPNSHIIYDNQLYYRMNPTNAPDGTLNFIHIDTIEDGNGGYKATGKCFSITVSTRAWQVFDLDFGRSYTHNVIIENGSTGEFVHFTLINNHPDSYAENAEGLRVSIGDAKINCTVTDGARYYAGIIYQDGGYFHFEYGDSNHVQATTSQVTVTDTIS